MKKIKKEIEKEVLKTLRVLEEIHRVDSHSDLAIRVLQRLKCNI